MTQDGQFLNYLTLRQTQSQSSTSTAMDAAWPACISRHGVRLRCIDVTVAFWKLPPSEGPINSLSPSRMIPFRSVPAQTGPTLWTLKTSSTCYKKSMCLILRDVFRNLSRISNVWQGSKCDLIPPNGGFRKNLSKFPFVALTRNKLLF